jgi:hypothetical protein
MTSVVIIDKEIENLECIKEGNRDLYLDVISVLTDDDIVDEYAINVNDMTWEEIEDEHIKRLTLNEEDFKRYIENSYYIFVYKDGKYKLCIHD